MASGCAISGFVYQGFKRLKRTNILKIKYGSAYKSRAVVNLTIIKI